ncbi:hypothetical protein QQ045_013229 [Rhodiola kirilowii]
MHLSTKTAYDDGMQSLYTAGALKFMQEVFDVDQLDRPKRKFKVEIKMISRQLETINQALAIVLRHFPTNNTDFTVAGRSFFSKKPATKLGDGFEYWKAYYHSIRPTQMGLALNLDVSAKVFYEPICVTDFIAKYCVKDVTKPLSDQDCIKVKEAVEGIKVKVTHRKTERSGYRITGITNQMSSEVTFLFRGTQISVAEYYLQLYGPLKYPHLPCLQAGSEKKRIDLPMEVCIIEEGQRFSKKLNQNHLLKATGKGPVGREKAIREMVEQKHFHDDFVKNFGIKVSDQFTSIYARVLPTPTLRYGGSDYNPQKGQWDMNDKKMIDGATVERWTYVSFSRKLPKGAVIHFYDKLIEKCCERGMVFSESPVVPPILSADPEQIEKNLKDIHEQCREKSKRLQLLLVILPDINGSHGHETIKRVCEAELGIVSQCIKPKQAQMCHGRTLNNLALQMNVKMGGRNTVLVDTPIALASGDPTIIFGADVTHPQPGDDTSPSIAAVCNVSLVMISNLQEVVVFIFSQYLFWLLLILEFSYRKHLIAFKRSTGQTPGKIIFYRDGVGEGQFNQVLVHEMGEIKTACASLDPEYQPAVTFVVVQKRNRTRFFPSDHANEDYSGNVLPGTVVDWEICHPTMFDFYLKSHAGNEGTTSRAAHYYVLYDENNFDADKLQSLTNDLCYTYARCTKSVSIVPPAYYAHLLAFRGRCYHVEGSDWTPGELLPIRILQDDDFNNLMFYC